MKASLILLRVEIGTPKLKDSPVVPPQKEAHCTLQQICHNHKGPEFWSEDVLWRELHQRWDVTPLGIEVRTTNNVDWNQDATANDRQHDEDVADHPQKSQKHNSI